MLCRMTPCCLACLMALLAAPLRAQEAEFFPVAIVPFQERGSEVQSLGGKTSDLLFANLVANPNIYLVERQDLKSLLGEQELNISGLVDPSQATRIGQLTGAKIIVTGSVLQVGDQLYLVAKIIGVETTRVLGASVKGQLEEPLDQLAEKLAEAVADKIAQNSGDLIPPPAAQKDRLADLRKRIKDGKRPTVFIDIPERHVGAVRIDPAAQTELMLFCRELGFEVLDSLPGAKGKADVLLVGEGMSEFAARHGNLSSVRARLEVKAVDRRTGRVLAVDRQTSIRVGLAEQIAAKAALQEAAAEIATRLIPKIVAGK